MVCILANPCARVIKFLLIATGMAMIPKPDPPDVTVIILKYFFLLPARLPGDQNPRNI